MFIPAKTAWKPTNVVRLMRAWGSLFQRAIIIRRKLCWCEALSAEIWVLHLADLELLRGGPVDPVWFYRPLKILSLKGMSCKNFEHICEAVGSAGIMFNKSEGFPLGHFKLVYKIIRPDCRSIILLCNVNDEWPCTDLDLRASANPLLVLQMVKIMLKSIRIQFVPYGPVHQTVICNSSYLGTDFKR